MTDTRPVLVFDLDGTLAETAGDLMTTLNVILAGENIAPVPLTQARYMLGAGARALIRRGFSAQGVPLSPEKLEQLFQGFLHYYEAHIADHSHLFPGVMSALNRFQDAGWILAVCTNKMEGPARKLLTALGVADHFALIAGQDTYAIAKPDPRILAMTIRDAGGIPANAVMVGDSRTDIDTARTLGIPVIAVDFGYTDTPVAQLGPDRIIAHFDQLWDAVASLGDKTGDLLHSSPHNP